MRTVGVAGAAAAGAVIEYLFDRDRGRARRARVRGKAVRAAHRLNRGAIVLSRDMAGRGRGVVAGTRYHIAGRHVDDDILHERVRAELGRHVSHPHAVEVHVEDGIVRLNGDVLTPEAKPTQRALRRVPGVKEIDAQWTTHTDPTGVPGLQGAGRHEPRHERWNPTLRFLAGSTAAATWAASRRLPRPVAWLLRAPSALLAARAATNLPVKRLTGIGAGRRAIDVNGTVCVDAPPSQVWPLVADYGVFPQFMPDVHEVRRSADGRLSHWEIRGPGGVPVRFDAEETMREEGREIAWETTDGQLIAHAGTVRLDPEPNNRTRVHIHLTYNPVAGAVGHAVATLLGADPKHRLHTDLQRLKSLVEAK